MKYDDNNIFAKILRSEIQCDKIYEDKDVLFFKDITGFFFKGFFFVIAQIRRLRFNFFKENFEIAKCPLWGGSKVPPKIPIFFDISVLKFRLRSNASFPFYYVFIRG